jgi:hypothetical protein
MRQFATVLRDTDNLAAIVAFDAPSAAISNALARTTSRCAPDCDRANDSNTSRWASVTVNAGTGLLMFEIISNNCRLFAGHTTSWPYTAIGPRATSAPAINSHHPRMLNARNRSSPATRQSENPDEISPYVR